MLTPTIVGGLKQSLKYVMRWELLHQCPGHVVVSVTEQAYQHLIPLNTLKELSQFQFWTTFFLSLTSSLVQIKKLLFKVYTWYHQVLVTEDLATVSSVEMKVRELYAIDLPNVSSLSGEIHNWYTKWKSEENDHGSNLLPPTLSSTLTRIFSFYRNIKVLVTILCSLPLTSCTAERSFSRLKRIKPVLRSSMSNERLSSLIILHMHQRSH